MKLFLIRHAKAMKRASWQSSDLLRPLTRAGHGQAQALAARLGAEPIGRIVSSPTLRCRQTVGPLATARGLTLEVDERLAEGSDVAKVQELVRALGPETTVLASHGDVIAALLCELEEQGLEVRDRLICEKSSVWEIEGAGATPERARYRPPPARGKLARRLAGRGIPEAALALGDEPESEEMRVAVLDLGSTSFHLLVAEVNAEGEISEVTSEREMLRLGAMIASDRVIPDEVFRRAVESARRLRKTAVRARAERLFPVATAALREARNGAELARRIGRALDNPVRILSGAEEARIIFQALRRRTPLPEGVTLAVDLGGGSLELAFGDRAGVHWEATLPIGVARLQRACVPSDPMGAEAAAALRARVGEALGPAREAAARFRPRLCVATGGTVAALGRLVTARRGRAAAADPLDLPLDELRSLADALIASDAAERARMPGMTRRRIDLLPTGASVLVTLAETLELEGYRICDWGLREGVIIEELGLERLGEARREAARAEAEGEG